MPRLINSFRQTENPLAKTLGALGQSMFGDTLTPALKRAQLDEAERQNFGTEELARLAGAGGILDPNKSAEMAVLGGMKPDDLAMLQVFLSGNLLGPRDEKTTNAMAGAGKYSQSANAFDIDQGNAMERHRITDATQRYNIDIDASTSRANNADTISNSYRQFQETPKEARDAAGNPVFVQQSGLTQPGISPILSDSQRTPLEEMKTYLQAAEANGLKGADAQAWALDQISKRKGTSITVGPDGTTVEMGGPSGLTNSVLSKAQNDTYSFEKANAVADAYEGLLKSDPTLVGATGWARDIAQGGAQLAGNIAQLFGTKDISQAVNAIRDEAIAKGVDPGIVAQMITFDPKIPQLSAAYNVLLYSFADALAGQSGRSVTDKDIKQMKQILGDPSSFFASQPDALARLQTARGLLDAYETANNKRQGINRPPRTYGQQPGGTSGKTGSGVNWKVVQ